MCSETNRSFQPKLHLRIHSGTICVAYYECSCGALSLLVSDGSSQQDLQ